MRQKDLTVITPITPGKVSSLRSLLNKIGEDITGNEILDFSRFSTIHFMRWVILDEVELDGEMLPARLVLSTNYDGPLGAHLRDFIGHGLTGLQKIYSHCEDAPQGEDLAKWVGYFMKFRESAAAFYRGTAGRRLSQIRQEQDLWVWLQNHIDQSRSSGNPETIYDQLRDFVKQESQLSWVLQPYRREWEQALGGVILIGIILIILALMVFSWIEAPVFSGIMTGLVLLFFGFWWWRLRRHEEADLRQYRSILNDPGEVAHLARREDYKIQNQITHLVEVKPGWVRQFALRLILWAINLLARFIYNKGNLGGIQSIHFARWVILDGGRRLLFFSNYDGSWESYLGEFVNRAAVGLTGVWSNTVGFPPTRNLVGQGARYSADFKAWARAKQIETQVWYSAYPHLSIKNINNNTAIRQGFSRKLRGTQILEWLQRI